MQIDDINITADKPHAQILKATTIIGGSSVINVVFKIVQAKLVAVLIGPSGVGLMGLFNATLSMATTLAGMGLSTSGVRQIAQASSSGDTGRIARTVTAFRWLALFFGLLGALLFFAFRQPITQMTFGNAEHTAAIGSLALALLLTVVSNAQSTLIRGMRRIADLARVSVIGIAIGTFLGIPLLIVWGLQGVAPYLILSAITTILVTWWYARKIQVAKVPIRWKDISPEARNLLSLGVVFMVTGLATIATTYLVKVVVTRKLGLESAGLFEASSALSNVYVGFILGAMGADFFPHLASLSHDHKRSVQLINAQVEVGLLVAIPGILAVLALGPFIFKILYSSQFVAAFDILRWQALGTFLRVISWPVGYLILASGKNSLYFLTELSTNFFYLIMVGLCTSLWGVPGIGVAFFCMYIIYVVLMTFVARRLISFQWSARNLLLVISLFSLVLVAFFASYFLPSTFSTVLGLVLASGTGVFTLKSFYTLAGPDLAQAYWIRVKTKLGWSKA